MRAAVVTEFGSFDKVVVDDMPSPEVGQGELLVRVSVAGVNFADAGMILGTARRAMPPFVPGVEAAGRVEKVGQGVEGFKVGDRVVYWNPQPGAFAELAAVPAWRTVAIPRDVTDDAAVALMVQGTTAHYLATTPTTSPRRALA